MLSIQELTEKNKIIPVVKIKNIRQAVPLAKALYEGGIGCMEITFRTPDAAQAIRQVADEAAYMLVGAGTVTTKEQAEAAADAGARFIVSPGFSEKVASFCKEKDILYLPGCVTPTEIMKAMEYGIQTVKFFPAQILWRGKGNRGAFCSFWKYNLCTDRRNPSGQPERISSKSEDTGLWRKLDGERKVPGNRRL